MCGIIGLYNKSLTGQEAKKLIQKTFDAQKHRGTDSYGIAYYDGVNPIKRWRTVEETEIFQDTIWNEIGPGFILFHHRYATSTIVIKEFGHPFLNETQDIALIHNGVVTNYKYLYQLLKAKHKFETMHKNITNGIQHNGQAYIETEEENINDSEVILHLYEDQGRQITRKLLDDSGQSFAIILIDTKKKEMILCRKWNPISMQKIQQKAVLFSSEIQEWQAQSLPYGEAVTINLQGEITRKKITEEPLAPQVWTGNWTLKQNPKNKKIKQIVDMGYEEDGAEKIIDRKGRIKTLKPFPAQYLYKARQHRQDPIVSIMEYFI